MPTPTPVGSPRHLALTLAALAATAALATPGAAFALTYTTTADFDGGSSLNVVTDSDEVKLNDETRPFNFIWVAVSSKNTIVKIDTTTGAVVGEYRTAPEGSGRGNPSRTTVDKNGSVWVGNREGGSIVHVGLAENGRCVDRNNNNQIDTSTGLGDVRPWPGSSAAEAADECIIHWTQNNGSDARHISVDENNDVWVSGTLNKNFDLIDGDTGAILRSESSVGYGGYGGLIDANGVIWSARPLLRWDTSLPLAPGNFTGYGHDSYGLCIGPDGSVWDTALEYNVIRKFDSSGTLVGTYNHGTHYAQGCVVAPDGHVWVASSLYDNRVNHLLPDGTYVGSVTVGSGPTGVAVDAAGKIWATNYNDGTVSRIDPTLGGIGGGGATIGAVDFTTVPLGGLTYNYSDMTGSTLVGAPDNGTWSVVRDSGSAGTVWDTVAWSSTVAGDGALTVTAATSDDGVTYVAPVTLTSGAAAGVSPGRYIRVSVAFARASTDESPVLLDLSILADGEQAACGNGEVEEGEECDDAGTTAGDGCDASCTVEPCWTCDHGPTSSTSTTLLGPGAPDSGPSICEPDDGQACDDGDPCTVDDGCAAGACGGEEVLIPAACEWAVVGGDPARDVRARTRGRTEVVGRICAEDVFVGDEAESAEVVGVAVDGSAIRVGRAAQVVGDVVTGGGSVRGKPSGTVLPGLAVDEVAGGSIVAKDATSDYDTTGSHALVTECEDAQADVDAGAGAIDGLPSTADLGNVEIPGNGSLTIAPGTTAGVVAGGLNVIDMKRLRTGNNTTITLDGGGDPSTVYVLRIDKKFDLRFRGDLVLAGGQQAGNVIVYGRNKCKVGEEATGAGTVLCPDGKLLIEERVTWNGALLGGKKIVQLREGTLLTHAPLQVGN